jgi:hypothetical protein
MLLALGLEACDICTGEIAVDETRKIRLRWMQRLQTTPDLLLAIESLEGRRVVVSRNVVREGCSRAILLLIERVGDLLKHDPKRASVYSLASIPVWAR